MKSKNNFIVDVRCPGNQSLRQMDIIMVNHPNGNNFVLPVNGCDDYGQYAICNKCRAAVTLMFYNGYKYKIDEPIIPDFEVLK